MGEIRRLGDYYDDIVSSVGYQTILSFDTNSLPDDCTIVSAVLELTRGAEAGDNPFFWAGDCLVDIANPYFGSVVEMENSDWEAAASAAGVAGFLDDPGTESVMVSTTFDADGLSNINKTGTTQLRVYFTTPSDSDSESDYLGFYSGEDVNAGLCISESKQPKLIIQYE